MNTTCLQMVSDVRADHTSGLHTALLHDNGRFRVACLPPLHRVERFCEHVGFAP
jgi:hypothetical protein